jgi:hypothetical protein
MYNPGYWVNRISQAQISEWRWICKHNRLVARSVPSHKKEHKKKLLKRRKDYR